jgi:hypothetical protein
LIHETSRAEAGLAAGRLHRSLSKLIEPENEIYLA